MERMEGFKTRFDNANGVEVILSESSYEMIDSRTTTYGWNPLVVSMDMSKITNFVNRFGQSGTIGAVSYYVLGNGRIKFWGGYGKDIATLL